jgi:hypothetical protein
MLLCWRIRPAPFSCLTDNTPHDGIIDEYGTFVQDDWRVSDRLVLNLGLRYDAYPVFRVRAISGRPAVMQNLEPPTDFRKMDFGAPRPADKPYDPDYNNFGPRFGFAWTLDSKAKTVVRGGVGVLHTAHALMWLDFSVSDPYIPLEVQWNATEVAERGVKWPMYSEDLLAIYLKDTGGKPSIFALNDTHLPNPYTVQTMFQRTAFVWECMDDRSRLHQNRWQKLSTVTQDVEDFRSVRPERGRTTALGAASGLLQKQRADNGVTTRSRQR